MKTADLIVVDQQDAEFVAEALKFVSTFDGCGPAVQKRAASLSKVFRKLAGKKRAK